MMLWLCCEAGGLSVVQVCLGGDVVFWVMVLCCSVVAVLWLVVLCVCCNVGGLSVVQVCWGSDVVFWVMLLCCSVVSVLWLGVLCACVVLFECAVLGVLPILRAEDRFRGGPRQWLLWAGSSPGRSTKKA